MTCPPRTTASAHSHTHWIQRDGYGQYWHDIDRHVDCQLQQMSDIAHTMGLPLSASMCFGLSEGISFSAQIERHFSLPYLIMLGRERDNFPHFARKIGIKFSKRRCEDATEFRDAVIEAHHHDAVIIALLDRYYLTYINQALAAHESAYKPQHFCQHVAGILAYHEGTSSPTQAEQYNSADEAYYLIADQYSNEPVHVPVPEVEQARLSNWDLNPPHGVYYRIEMPFRSYQNYNWPQLINESIGANCAAMLSPTGGIAHIRKLIQQIEVFDEETLTLYERAVRYQFHMLHSFIAEFEQTHSLYRWVYKDFLTECINDYGCHYLRGFPSRFENLGLLWRSLNDLLLIDDLSGLVTSLPKAIEHIANEEERCFAALQTAQRDYHAQH
ncbi:MAG: BtrH N-terminal domain-containing protein [Eggerthellaceae bacterium]|nr:BtrH N-terminal domain-containing protein [Eggerthellaceae bacterium]